MQFTPVIFSPDLISEVANPSLQELQAVILDEPMDATKLCRLVSKITRQTDRGQSELGRLHIPIDVHVRRLGKVVADEIEAVGSTAQDCGHGELCPEKALAIGKG